MTNAATATAEAAKATLETAAAPVKEAAPQVVAATNPAPEKPQGVVSQAQTTLAGLSQDQMVQGLKDALAKGCNKPLPDWGMMVVSSRT